MTVKAVVFDYGGTLVRERRPWVDVWPEAVQTTYKSLKRVGLKLPFEEYKDAHYSVLQQYRQLEVEENRDIPDLLFYGSLVDRLFPSRAKAWRKKVAERTNDTFWVRATGNFVPRRETRPALKKLKEMKLRMAVISNHHNPRAVVEHLGEMRIASYFSRTLVSAKVGVRKPDPRIFEMCLRGLRVPPREAVYVGDSPENDVVGSKAAGMVSILLADGPTSHLSDGIGVEPDFVVSNLIEVPEVVASIA